MFKSGLNGEHANRTFRSVAGVAVTAVAALILAACSGGSSTPVATAKEGETVTVRVAPGIANYFVAKSLGIDKKYGIDLEINDSRIAAPTLLPSLGKQYEFGSVTIPDVLNGLAAGLDPTIVTLDTSGTKEYPISYLVADKSINSIKDLKGKSIATIAESGTHYVAFLELLKKNGLTAQDVSFVSMFPGAMAGAMEAGRVQAALIPPPAAYELVAKYKVLGTPAHDIGDGDAASSVLVTSAAWAKENPVTVDRFRAMMVEAQEWINAHIKETAQVYIDNLGDSEETIALAGPSGIIHAGLGLEPTQALVEPWIKAMTDLGVLNKTIDAADTFVPWPDGLSSGAPTAEQLKGQGQATS